MIKQYLNITSNILKNMKMEEKKVKVEMTAEQQAQFAAFQKEQEKRERAERR